MAILLVDDEKDITDIIKSNLRREPWQVFTASSGEEAIKLLEENPAIEILATDFHMPGMDGAQLINQALAFRPELYTIVFTGWTEREITIKALRVGADDFIDKGSDIDEKLKASIYRGLKEIAITRMGRELLREKTEAGILAKVLESLKELNHFGGICLATRELGSDSCRVEKAVDLKTGKVFDDRRFLAANSAYLAVIEEQRAYFPSILAPGSRDLKPWLEETQSIIVVPITFRSHERGALGIEHREKGRYKVEDMKFLSQVANWISVAMEMLTKEDRVDLERTRSLRDQGLLACSLIHELKNPLNNISMAADAAMESVDSPALHDLGSNIERMNKALDRFLNPLIPGSGAKESIDLNRTIGEAIARTRTYFPRGSVQLDYRVGSALPQFQGNRNMLVAALVSLLENSQKALEAPIQGSQSENTSKTISIRAMYSELRRQIEVMISDNGPGIPQRSLGQIFDYGYSTKGEGHFGYGLALAQEIIQVHGGSIAVDSQEGEGATFKLTFPISTADSATG